MTDQERTVLARRLIFERLNRKAMSTDAMKLELIEWLTKLKDPGMIASLLNWKKASEAEDWYVALSPEQKASIDRGLADANAGRTIPSAEVWKRYGRSAKG